MAGFFYQEKNIQFTSLQMRFLPKSSILNYLDFKRNEDRSFTEPETRKNPVFSSERYRSKKFFYILLLGILKSHIHSGINPYKKSTFDAIQSNIEAPHIYHTTRYEKIDPIQYANIGRDLFHGGERLSKSIFSNIQKLQNQIKEVPEANRNAQQSRFGSVKLVENGLDGREISRSTSTNGLGGVESVTIMQSGDSSPQTEVFRIGPNVSKQKMSDPSDVEREVFTIGPSGQIHKSTEETSVGEVFGYKNNPDTMENEEDRSNQTELVDVRA